MPWSHIDGGTMRGAWGDRPWGGVPFLMRCRRISRTCAGSVITAMIFMSLRHRGQHKGLPLSAS